VVRHFAEVDDEQRAGIFMALQVNVRGPGDGVHSRRRYEPND
jgi:hypothetical protein